jgi:hypothetical protein
MSTVVVAGAMASKIRNGGEAWVRLSWVRAFQRLGFDVWFVEQVAGEALVDEQGYACRLSGSAALRYFTEVMRQFGLEGRACLMSGSGEWWGTAPETLNDIADRSEMLLNVSGNLTHRPLLERFRKRVYLDIDPGFTQYWHAQGLLGTALEEHNHHFTIGENIGRPGCPIPDSGLRWRTTRQPVVLEDWPAQPFERCERLTTVGSLRGPYGRVEHAGGAFGLKIHEMRRLAPLPELVEPSMELAIAIDPGDAADRRRLVESGWTLVDPKVVAGGPQGFREYVQGSDGEFSVAQGIYAETGSGWFSDRTVRYLASARPAIVQDTGLAPHLPVGEGVLTFRTLGEAAEAVQSVRAGYPGHCRAARQIAEEYFEAGRVAGALVSQIGVAP